MTITTRLFACLMLVLHLPACSDDLPNPNARIEREALLIAPGATYAVLVDDVVDRGGLRLRTHGHVVEASIEREDSLFGETTVIEITGDEIGTTEVELLDGDLLLDTLTVEVAAVDHLALAPGQNTFDGVYPGVAEPFGILVQHGVVVQATPRSADERSFDTPVDWDVTLEAGADVEVSSISGPFFRVEVDSAGSHTLTLISENGAMRDVELLAVDASAIVALELQTSNLERGTVTLSVVGVTADGRRIIGLDPVLTVNGVALTSTIGSWIFERTAPLAADAVVTATWHGLTVTR